MTELKDAEDSRPFDQQVMLALRRIFRKVTEYSKALHRDAGVTVPQLSCLRAIREFPDPGPTLIDISLMLQISPSTVTGIVDRLELNGLITKTRSTVDRRKLNLTLTPDGRALVQRLPRPLQEEFADRLDQLGEKERVKLLDSLNLLVNLMEARELNASPFLTSDSSLDQ